jgi:hypothetical protein
MAEIRVQVAYHFKIDPAKLEPGKVRLPEQVTRTVAIGEEMITEKVSIGCIPIPDVEQLTAELEKQVREATRTARPAGSPGPVSGDEEPGEHKEEMSAF